MRENSPRDHIEETTACIAILAANLRRFATDFYVRSGFEFGFVEVAEQRVLSIGLGRMSGT